jgi:hypothetical protein
MDTPLWTHRYGHTVMDTPLRTPHYGDILLWTRQHGNTATDILFDWEPMREILSVEMGNGRHLSLISADHL